MSALTLLLAVPSLPVAGQGGSVGAGSGQSAAQSWLDPAVPWPLLAAAILTLTFVSALVSVRAWSGTRRHHEISSIGRGTSH